MRNINAYHPGCASVYPGSYEPSPSKEAAVRSELHKKGHKVIKPVAIFREEQDYHLVEIAVPGFNREDFFIYTNGYTLSVNAVNGMCCKKTSRGIYPPDSYTKEYVSKNIPLPKDVDTDFVTAEYLNGVLRIYLFKGTRPAQNSVGEIIVY